MEDIQLVFYLTAMSVKNRKLEKRDVHRSKGKGFEHICA